MRQRNLFVLTAGKNLKNRQKNLRKQRESTRKLFSTKFDWDKGGELILKFVVLFTLFLLALSFVVGGGILVFLMSS